MAEEALTKDTPADARVALKPHRYSPALDGVRGFAILAVMLYHFNGGYRGTNSAMRLWSALADLGWIGVDLFFVLSGFLITGILYDTAKSERRVRNFYARRALRIFPLFYGVLFALLALTPILHLRWQWGHAVYFFYLSNMSSWLVPGLAPISESISLSHLWSLAVEEQFYLLWPFLVWWIGDYKTLLRIILVILIATPMLRGWMFTHGTSIGLISALLLTRMDSLLFGAGTALLVRGPWRDRLPGRSVLALSVIVLCVLGRRFHSPEMFPTTLVILGYSLIAVAASSLVYLSYRGDNFISIAFSHRILRFFGKYSYGLYFFHGIIFVYFRHLSGSIGQVVHSAAVAQIIALAAGFVVSVLMAIVSFNYFEKPILRLKDRFV